MSGKGSKMLAYVNWRMRVTIGDGRQLLGTFMAFDKHMNIVLGDCEEHRKVKGKKASEEKEEKRMLGLVLLRGENVISLQADAPPPPKPRAEQAGRGGPGAGRAAGRGLLTAPLTAPQGLTGPVKGLGGPGQSLMQPMAPVGRGAVVSSQPVAYGRGMPPSPMPPNPMMMMGRGGPFPPMPPNPMMMMGRGFPGAPPSGGPPFSMAPNPMMMAAMGRGMMPPMGMQPPQQMQGRGGPPKS